MSDTSFIPENTKILRGIEDTVSYGEKQLQNAKIKLDLCTDKYGPYIVMEFSVYKDNYIKARTRGVKIRFIAEITQDNIHYCKELRQYVDELRHLDGLKGAIAVSESEFVGTSLLQEKQYLTQLLYSREKEIVEQQQYIFDTFWKNSIPADLKIREIEEGIEPVKTEILEDGNEISKRIVKLAQKSNEMYICSTTGGMQLIYNDFFGPYKEILRKHSNGNHKGIKWIASINNRDEARLAKLFLKGGL